MHVYFCVWERVGEKKGVGGRRQPKESVIYQMDVRGHMGGSWLDTHAPRYDNKIGRAEATISRGRRVEQDAELTTAATIHLKPNHPSTHASTLTRAVYTHTTAHKWHVARMAIHDCVRGAEKA